MVFVKRKEAIRISHDCLAFMHSDVAKWTLYTQDHHANLIGSHTVHSILATAMQLSARPLHDNRAAVLRHSQSKYMSVSLYNSRTNTLRCLAAALQQSCESIASSLDRTRRQWKRTCRKFSFCHCGLGVLPCCAPHRKTAAGNQVICPCRD